MSKLSSQELLWRAQQLQNASADIDEPLRCFVENSSRITEDQAAQEVFDDKHTKRAPGRLRELVKFLLQPTSELTPKSIEFRNELMAEYRLPSLLRIYKSGVWYEQFCVYLKEFVVPKWKNFKKTKPPELKKRPPKKIKKNSWKPVRLSRAQKAGSRARKPRPRA